MEIRKFNEDYRDIHNHISIKIPSDVLNKSDFTKIKREGKGVYYVKSDFTIDQILTSAALRRVSPNKYMSYALIINEDQLEIVEKMVKNIKEIIDLQEKRNGLLFQSIISKLHHDD